MIKKMSYSNIIFSATFGIVLLWIIAGINKLVYLNHYGVTIKLIEFNTIDAFLPIMMTVILVVSVVFIPSIIFYRLITKIYKTENDKKLSSKNIMKYVLVIILALVFGFFLLCIYIIPMIYFYSKGDLQNISKFLARFLLVLPFIMYFSIFNLLDMCIFPETIKPNLITMGKLFFVAISLWIFIMIILHSLFVGYKDLKVDQVMDEAGNVYVLIDKISAGLLVTPFTVDEKQNQISVSYGEYKIISAENVTFIKSKFSSVNVLKKE